LAHYGGDEIPLIDTGFYICNVCFLRLCWLKATFCSPPTIWWLLYTDDHLPPPPPTSRQQRQLRANTFTFRGVYCLYVAVAVSLELLTFIQCMLTEMDVPPQSIAVKYKRGVGGRRAGDCKRFFKLCLISGFRSDRNGICAVQGCYVAYSQAQELDP
jgi:hypothetical protein